MTMHDTPSGLNWDLGLAPPAGGLWCGLRLVAELTQADQPLPADAPACLVVQGGMLRWVGPQAQRSEEHTSELQSPDHLVCLFFFKESGAPRDLPSSPTGRSSDLTTPSPPMRRPAWWCKAACCAGSGHRRSCLRRSAPGDDSMRATRRARARTAQ